MNGANYGFPEGCIPKEFFLNDAEGSLKKCQSLLTMSNGFPVALSVMGLVLGPHYGHAVCGPN